MNTQPVDTSSDRPSDKPTAVPPGKKSFRRTTLSTGFSDVPGKVCEVCGFQAFRWQSKCPEGHPLA